MLLQLHVASDVGAERAGVMRERGAAEAGMKVFGDGRAAYLGAAFEHQRFESCFGEIEGGDQTIVSATDDDHIARFGHWAYATFPSFKISSAARRPGAPRMPPPGCVADPHM